MIPKFEKKVNQKLNFSLAISESNQVNNDFTIKGTAINAVTTRNGHTFLAEELQMSAGSLDGRPLLKDHNNSVDSIAGKVMSSFYDPLTQSIKFSAKVLNAQCRQMIQEGLITAVSVGANVKSIEEGDNGNIILRGIEFVELSLVAVPADPGANFAMAVMQSLNIGNDANVALEKSNGIPHQEKMVEKIEEKKETVSEASEMMKLMKELIEQNKAVAEQNKALTEKVSKMEEAAKAKVEEKKDSTKGKVAISEEVEKEFNNFVLEKDGATYSFYAASFADNKILGRGN